MIATVACGDDGGSGDAEAGRTESSTGTTDEPTTAPPETGEVSSDSSSSESEGESSSSESGSDSSETSVSACTVKVPEAWAAPDWDKNTVTALALRTQLDTLVTFGRGVEQGTETLASVDDLTDLLEAGDPSVADVGNEGFAPVLADVFEEFVELAAVGEADLIDDAGLWTPGDNGGIFGGSDRGLNEGGLEVRQIIDKGLFGGGALYNAALLLTAEEIDEATIDSIAALFGGNSELNPEAEAGLTDSANYVYQMGFHGAFATALTAAKAYAADEACVAERDLALVAAFRAWEIGLFARFVYYSNEAAAAVELATTDDELAGALHELGEGTGLVSGFYGLTGPESGPLADAPRVSTDGQIEDLLAAIRIDIEDLGASTTGTFVENYLDFVDAVEEADGVVAEIFDLDAAEVEAWHETSPG